MLTLPSPEPVDKTYPGAFGHRPSSKIAGDSNRQSLLTLKIIQKRGESHMDPKKWMTINETASYLRMSVAYLRKAVSEKTIPFTRVGNKSLRFDREALDAWLISMSSSPRDRK